MDKSVQTATDGGRGAAARVRTCVGCRRRDNPDQMVRIVAVDAPPRTVIDQQQRMPGRGAWLHPGCAQRAVRGRAVARALRIAGDVDMSQLHRLAEATP